MLKISIFFNIFEWNLWEFVGELNLTWSTLAAKFPKCSEYAAQRLNLAVIAQITNYSNQNIVYIKIAGD